MERDSRRSANRMDGSNRLKVRIPLSQIVGSIFGVYRLLIASTMA
jgi:hypothetical protein